MKKKKRDYVSLAVWLLVAYIIALQAWLFKLNCIAVDNSERLIRQSNATMRICNVTDDNRYYIISMGITLEEILQHLDMHPKL